MHPQKISGDEWKKIMCLKKWQHQVQYTLNCSRGYRCGMLLVYEPQGHILTKRAPKVVYISIVPKCFGPHMCGFTSQQLTCKEQRNMKQAKSCGRHVLPTLASISLKTRVYQPHQGQDAPLWKKSGFSSQHKSTKN